MKRSILLAILFIAIVALTLGIRAWNAKNDSTVTTFEKNEIGFLKTPVMHKGMNYLIPPTEIFPTGILAEDMPPVMNPLFTIPAYADAYLADEVEGIALTLDGKDRYYSYHIMNWHGVVNDAINEKPVLVSQCVFCHGAAVYSRELDGKTLSFAVTGDVYNNNLLLRDEETGSLWLQTTGQAIAGSMTGKRLERIPFTVQTWRMWSDNHSDGEVLAFDDSFGFEYARHPLANYDASETIYFPLSIRDGRIALKNTVNVYENDTDSVAFVKTVLSALKVQNEKVGEESIVGIFDEETKSIRVFSREVEVAGEVRVLTFTYDEKNGEMKDEETDSVWSSDGMAVSGSLKGEKLRELGMSEMFWMCWSGMRANARYAGEAQNEIDAETGTVEVELDL